VEVWWAVLGAGALVDGGKEVFFDVLVVADEDLEVF
jgi:hypothetical protein